jgi:hypothetical protein
VKIELVLTIICGGNRLDIPVPEHLYENTKWIHQGAGGNKRDYEVFISGGMMFKDEEEYQKEKAKFIENKKQ